MQNLHQSTSAFVGKKMTLKAKSKNKFNKKIMVTIGARKSNPLFADSLFVCVY
jgi:hypothetical protein